MFRNNYYVEGEGKENIDQKDGFWKSLGGEQRESLDLRPVIVHRGGNGEMAKRGGAKERKKACDAPKHEKS